MKHFGSASFLLATLVAASPAAAAVAATDLLPAETLVHFHVTTTLASNVTQVGSRFQFVITEPIVIDGATIVAKDAIGDGTVLVSGHAGGLGHEGDLTLRFDSVPTVDGRFVLFDDERAALHGRNRKLLSGLGSLIPYVGLGFNFIKGSDLVIEPKDLGTERLDRAAHVVAVLPSPVATAIATAPASPPPASTSSPLPSPTSSASPEASASPR